MKPSQRIKQLIQEQLKKDENHIDIEKIINDLTYSTEATMYVLKGIIDYLDEHTTRIKTS